MKNFMLLIGLCVWWAPGFAQLLPVSDSILSAEKAAAWFNKLSDPGITMTGDSIYIGEEFYKVLQEEQYRKILYPEKYTWESTLAFMKANDLKKAFWFFINLYPENQLNKELVVKSVLAYDIVLQMDKMLVNTFYTYIFMDPECSVITDGKPEIIRPDIMEQKLAVVREIVGYVYNYREQKGKRSN